jgi:hypothetical protein
LSLLSCVSCPCRSVFSKGHVQICTGTENNTISESKSDTRTTIVYLVCDRLQKIKIDGCRYDDLKVGEQAFEVDRKSEGNILMSKWAEKWVAATEVD